VAPGSRGRRLAPATFVTLAAVMALVVAACSPGSRLAASDRKAPAAAPSPSAPAPGKCPLTDLDPPAGVPVTRPVLAVKVDDAIPGADPQSGLDAADIVYDEPVEGGLDWFVALFQCGNPSTVGPIREAEMEDPGILSQYGSSLFAYAPDVQAPVLQAIHSTAGIVSVDSVTEGRAYSRNASRRAPYNLFANPAALWSAGTSRATSTALSAPTPQFMFTPTTAQVPTPDPSPAASTLTFTLGPTIQYRYDAQTDAYQRYEAGQPMLAASGSQISVTNVVLVWAQINPSRVVDGAGNASPLPVLTGQGQAMVLTGGQEFDGQWTRAGATNELSFETSGGKPIPFTPGNTWIHILPADTTANVQ
jgi:hypothetical protein